MGTSHGDYRIRSLVAVGLAALLLAALVGSAEAQGSGPAATVRRLTGRVEIMRQQRLPWVPAVLGAQLAVGDDIRAFAASSALLSLPDGSTLLVAENSRLVVTKLDFDAQNRNRSSVFHLVLGKVRAVVAQAAFLLVRGRQANFAITTPTAVAAARGTDFVVIYENPTTAGPLEGDIFLSCGQTWLSIPPGFLSVQCGPPQPIPDLGAFGSANHGGPPPPGDPATWPDPDQVLQELQTSLGLTFGPPGGSTTQLSQTPPPNPLGSLSPSGPPPFGLQPGPPALRAR